MQQQADAAFTLARAYHFARKFSTPVPGALREVSLPMRTGKEHRGRRAKRNRELKGAPLKNESTCVSGIDV